MNKKIITMLLVFAVSPVVFAYGDYSSGYLNKLKTCTPFEESFDTNIDTGNAQMPVFSLVATERVIGWLGGRCVTQSSAYSKELGQEVLTTTCSFSKEQMDSIVRKLEKADSGDRQAFESLKQELNQYIQDGDTCRVKTPFDQMH